ncbi:MAG: hypothetical protein M3162_06250 [Thermoproteota archaeon]|nr:hypothetical protein [Thermoproteota archaeon]
MNTISIIRRIRRCNNIAFPTTITTTNNGRIANTILTTMKEDSRRTQSNSDLKLIP